MPSTSISSALLAMSGLQHVVEVVVQRDVELIEGAAGRLTVGPPPHELDRVPEAHAVNCVALHLVVGDLTDLLRAHRYPAFVRSGVPPAWLAVVDLIALALRFQLCEQLD